MLDKFHVTYTAPCASIIEDMTILKEFDKIAPSLRGDDMAAMSHQFIRQLEEVQGREITTLADYFRQIGERLRLFHEAGCRFADHGLDNGFHYYPDDGNNHKRFRELRDNMKISLRDQEMLSSEILRFLASAYGEMNWTMQLHIGAQRYTSTRLRQIAGPAGGFAGIGSGCDVDSLTRMLDDFEKGRGGLPRTILFTLNPADNAVMAVLGGSYSQDGMAGKVQLGPAWWWNDHLYGMREVFETISTYGVLSVFAGMTTDSRSILSNVRHEYFRRAFCGWMGDKVGNGEMPGDKDALRKLAEDVCFNNAKQLL
jgi:glucuronate isomerase